MKGDKVGNANDAGQTVLYYTVKLVLVANQGTDGSLYRTGVNKRLQELSEYCC